MVVKGKEGWSRNCMVLTLLHSWDPQISPSLEPIAYESLGKPLLVLGLSNTVALPCEPTIQGFPNYPEMPPDPSRQVVNFDLLSPESYTYRRYGGESGYLKGPKYELIWHQPTFSLPPLQLDSSRVTSFLVVDVTLRLLIFLLFTS
jgi:hypothetical protein